MLITAASLGPREANRDLPDTVERGRYLVKVAGCNDCHKAAR